ncbi:NUDIX hydrolase domain-like protein [Radiomyces spectabilis]|uniref:NUDIX hydrolase domain-like protein n=1 Tax=Radiomyces spectabilis TaxID=64574 RepID=UPI0022205CAB|nr:NUDIX hydrolase domain-like protein [Radiomyces spectabilis]KAI8368172.1 NUDIX hydrolase domain-like protein [Radiomyces spectabilis]
MHYSEEARIGRANQIYDDNDVRQVAGCLPIDPRTKRILLISSSKHEGVWVIPKGGWENDETQVEAALRETWEEAGVRGVISGFLGCFYDSNKKGQAKSQFWIYELLVDEIMKKWPEKKKRERRWFTFDEAITVLAPKPFMQDAVRKSSIAPKLAASPARS